MKASALLCLCGALSLLAGCHNWPKDSLLKNAKSTVNTPWGPSTIEAGVIATGAAARNLTESERRELLSK